MVAAHALASNRLVNVEILFEEEFKVIQKYYGKLGNLTKKDESLLKSHSIDEAGQQDELKNEYRGSFYRQNNGKKGRIKVSFYN